MSAIGHEKRQFISDHFTDVGVLVAVHALLAEQLERGRCRHGGQEFTVRIRPFIPDPGR